MTPAQLTRVLRLLELLRSRKSVDMATLERESGVSQRSVFRYLKAMQEAGILIEYDRVAKRYRLDRTRESSPWNLELNEIGFVVFALDLLSLHVEGSISKMIAEIREKILDQQPYTSPGSFDSFRNRINSLMGLPDLTPALMMAQLNIAIEMGKAVVVEAKTSDSEVTTIRVDKPRARFSSSQWWLCEAHSDRCYAMKDLVSVRVDTGS